MKMKIACFGVRDYEISYFNDLARKYDYEVDLFPQFLNTENYQDAYSYEVVMVRGNCVVNKEAMKDLYQHFNKKIFNTINSNYGLNRRV